MDIILICTICSGVVIVFLFYFLFKVQKRKINPHAQEEVPAQVPRRAIGNRNRIRGQPVARAGAQNVDDEQVEGTDEPAPDLKGDAKMGAKKRAKLEAKAEKKAQRENELKLREHRKKQLEREELERKQKEEKEKLEEQKIEEEKKRLQEEKERKEEEEYLKMKEGFTVEEEGFDEEGQTESQNLLQEFISHIKEKKVVMLEDLAGTFHLRIQTVINRIEELLANGTLTGVIDDRGKFIYITVEELQAVADFVKKRGRVTIQELVENSNKLITIH